MNKMMQRFKEKYNENERLAIKMTVRLFVIALSYEAVLLLLILLFLVISGVSSFDETMVFAKIKPFVLPAAIVVSLIGIWIIAYRFMLLPLQYLEEVSKAAQKLAYLSESPIFLPSQLQNIEDELNATREKALLAAKTVHIEDQRKEDLLVYLAHDLRTPLTSVLGYLRLVEDEPDLTPELAMKYTGIARRKAERLEELINEFFELARLSTRKLTYEASKVNLSRMLQQITYEFNPVLSEKKLEWDIQIENNVEITCDTAKLERTIDNLIRNAVNYSFPGTKIFFAMKSDGSQVKIVVRNSGHTIPPEKLERIFEQFYRLDESRSTDTGGAGLGLTIAKELIELQGGSIEAESKNETICFTIVLPRNGKTTT